MHDLNTLYIAAGEHSKNCIKFFMHNIPNLYHH